MITIAGCDKQHEGNKQGTGEEESCWRALASPGVVKEIFRLMDWELSLLRVKGKVLRCREQHVQGFAV